MESGYRINYPNTQLAIDIKSAFHCLPNKKKRVSCGVLWLAIENGYSSTIPRDENIGSILANQHNWCHVAIFTVIRFCCVYLWDQEEVLFYKLLPPGQTVTGDRYSKQLKQLHQELIKKCPQIARNYRKVILLHDNARPYIVKKTKEALLDLKWEVLPHLTYSPDIAPSHYLLFRSMQHSLSGEHFSDITDVRKWIDKWIALRNDFFFQRDIRMLPER